MRTVAESNWFFPLNTCDRDEGVCNDTAWSSTECDNVIHVERGEEGDGGGAHGHRGGVCKQECGEQASQRPPWRLWTPRPLS